MKPMPVYMEPGDAARALDVAAATLRGLADSGVLRMAAMTVRRVRLFDPGDVEALKRRREEQLLDEMKLLAHGGLDRGGEAYGSGGAEDHGRGDQGAAGPVAGIHGRMRLCARRCSMI